MCHNFNDYLEHTLPENVHYFDRLVVVTHPGDKKTQALCQKYGVECVQTEAMHDEGDAFNKGRCINIGLGHLRGLDWILHMDADIVLPHHFRNMLQRARLDPKNIYGADRLNVYGYDHWMAHKHKRYPHYSSGYFVQPLKEFPVGARIVHHEHGYTPIGYFQLWHKSAHKKYPINQGNAEHTDVLFAIQWPRNNRVLLPEVLVYHLEACDGPRPMGGDWSGRTSKHFGPCPHCKCCPCKCSHHKPYKPPC